MAQIYTVQDTANDSELGKIIGDARDKDGKYRNEQLDIRDKDIEEYIFTKEQESTGIGINLRFYGFTGKSNKMSTDEYKDLVKDFNKCVDDGVKTVIDCMTEYQTKNTKFKGGVMKWGVEILEMPSMLPVKGEELITEGESIPLDKSIEEDNGEGYTFVLPYANRQYKFFALDNENVYFYLVTKKPE